MRGFSYPGGVRVPSVFFYEDVVVTREYIGCRDNVHVNETLSLVFFRNRVVFSLHFLSKTLDILYHQVFLAKLITVGKVVHDLVFIQSDALVWVEYLRLDCVG